MSFLRRTLMGLTIAASTAAVGCGTSASSICSDVCDCEGCSEDEEKDCVDDVEDLQKDAEEEGCEDQVQELLDCYANELECKDSEASFDGCDSEAKSLNNCAGGQSSNSGGSSSAGGGPGGNVCDRAAEICGGSPSGGDCSGDLECASQCVVDAGTCETSDEGLASCFVDCSGGGGGGGS